MAKFDIDDILNELGIDPSSAEITVAAIVRVKLFPNFGANAVQASANDCQCGRSGSAHVDARLIADASFRLVTTTR